MAYLDLASGFAGASLARAPRADDAAPSVKAGFSGLEWSVILLAAKDRLSSLGEPGAMSRALGSLFGLGGPSRLADSRLEALRRMAVQAWHHGYQLPVSEISRFVDAGFSTDQVETLLASIAPRRVKQRGSARGIGTAA